METINIANRQTLMDAATLGKGDVQAAIEMSITQNVELTKEGGEVTSEVTVKDAGVVNNLSLREARPATAAGAINEGIGYWRIQHDFKVS
ncbi:hypothetical protein ACTJIJ_23025 [Niabella sp. 22666]|uniref:hypothetical protein n=1 Tax=Niabella sp. 22666 TaxID=3453954 RepID=UPI003F83D336